VSRHRGRLNAVLNVDRSLVLCASCKAEIAYVTKDGEWGRQLTLDAGWHYIVALNMWVHSDRSWGGHATRRSGLRGQPPDYASGALVLLLPSRAKCRGCSAVNRLDADRLDVAADMTDRGQRRWAPFPARSLMRAGIDD
jgi:hypothetical protein